jgi:hypothetical protein
MRGLRAGAGPMSGAACLHAAICLQQRGFELLEQRLVDPAAAEQIPQVGVEHFARARQSRLEARRPGSRC